jgi:molybdate transport system substrate-binding protein
MRIGLAICGILAGVLSGCSGSERPQERVVVFAAASTKEAVEQAAKDFQAETGIPVEVSLGSSSGLAKQIEQGRVTAMGLPEQLV